MFFGKPPKESPKAADDSLPVPVPAPVGGLNARDSLAAMPATDASELINWWPQPYGCSIRQGYSEHSTGLPDAVETLATWAGVDGTQKMFAWSDDSMFDVTAKAAVGAALISGLATARWETCNLVNAAGSYLIALAGNGVDNGIIYRAAGATRLTLGDGIVVDTWAGIDPQDATCPIVHQHRLWVLERNTPAGWYLPPDAIQGTFVKFDFGPLFSKGGYAQMIATWTLDDGNGAEDHLVVVSSKGEAVVFGGTDPSSDTTWSLVGVYNVGEPVAGPRAYTKAGGDLYLITQRGMVSMNGMLTSTRVNLAASQVTSDKIQLLFAEETSTNGALFGWDVMYIPRFNMLLTNVPRSNGTYNQLAANELINSWTKFAGISSSSWGIFNSQPYFGSPSGKVYKFWDGPLDNVLLDGSGGTSIAATAKQAYNYFGNVATQKQVGMYRPMFLTTAPVAVNSAIMYDFVDVTLTTPNPIAFNVPAVWDTSLWGVGRWGSSTAPQRVWYSSAGIGVAAALHLIAVSVGQVLWVSTDYTVVRGPSVL